MSNIPHRKVSSVEWNGIDVKYCYLPIYKELGDNLVVSQIDVRSEEPTLITKTNDCCIYLFQCKDNMLFCVEKKILARLAESTYQKEEKKVMSQVPLFEFPES